MENKKIYLKDYKPTSFFVDSIDLVVDIYEEQTFVSAIQKIKKSNDFKGKKLNLELNGENILLKDIKFNSKILDSEKYQVSKDKLTIFQIDEDEFVLETLVEINPFKNFALEGFYQSGPQLCTQCEPEGFRKITYFIDRPDNMSIFSTKMIADKQKYPFLLSNGNKVSFGDLAGGRHWVKWEDPFRKPSYLFAMVAGNFEVARDQFTTRSGRKVDLEIYVDPGNLFKTPHALESLKLAMKWDEEKFDLEYDLDIYMIVAVDSFNMGAMENKGLNIFNSAYTLADQKSATDHDFQNIQGVIGHEYFHNWTGNRVTCRDWFQLTLKEGLTVFRDQEFSSDMLSRPVKRLEDVKMLRDFQFPEDAGPLAHPIRPSSFVEINNFYTRTVYEKGAEIIRMLSVLIGEDNFKKGMKIYFELFDGKAVTTEDFVFAMEKASGRDLSQFKNWYSRAGTPTLDIKSEFSDKKIKLKINQTYPNTSWKVGAENILHIPFKIGFISQNQQEEHLVELTKLNEEFEYSFDSRPIISLNRGFCAPVIVKYDYSLDDLMILMAKDQDFYSRYEATQKIFEHLFFEDLRFYHTHQKFNPHLPASFIDGFSKLLEDSSIEDSFLAYLMDLPSEGSLSQDMEAPSFKLIHQVRVELEKKVGLQFHEWFRKKYISLSTHKGFDLTPQGYGRRSLKNRILTLLVNSGKGGDYLENHYFNASNMTEELHGLELYISQGVSLDHPAIKGFYEKWKNDSLTLIKWFGALSSHSPSEGILKRLELLESDRLFLNKVPNYLRALYGSFARLNLHSFHADDGSGYEFLVDRIIHIDKFNPQVAARISTNFSQLNKLETNQKEKMRKALNRILSTNSSGDTLEVVNKYLAQ